MTVLFAPSVHAGEWKMFDRRLGMFVHWGVYAVSGWHEQVQMRKAMSKESYAELVKGFDAAKFRADDLVSAAESAGAEYIVITTKHHDGFCLWATKATDFNVMNSPCGRDLIKELPEACARRGMKLGFYYSNPDWNQPNAWNPKSSHQLKAPNPGDEPDMAKYIKFVKTQITAGWVDRVLLPGKLTQPGVISNQGVLSTVPAVVTAMLGVFAGELLKRDDLSGNRKTAFLVFGAAALAAAGTLVAFAFGRWSMPFNKILWSSSFVLAVGGYSAAMLALFYWLIDVRGCWRHTLFFRVIGVNSITIYMLNRIMGFGPFARFFFGGLAGLLPDAWGKTLLIAATIAFEWLFLYVLYRKNMFLRV